MFDRFRKEKKPLNLQNNPKKAFFPEDTIKSIEIEDDDSLEASFEVLEEPVDKTRFKNVSSKIDVDSVKSIKTESESLEEYISSEEDLEDIPFSPLNGRKF